MTNTFTRTVTLSVSPPASGTHLDEDAVAYLIDNALQRLQGALGQLIAQGMLSGSFTYQEQTPVVSLYWAITVADNAPTLKRSPTPRIGD